MNKQQNLQEQIKKLLKQKKSKGYYAKRLGISELEVENLIEKVAPKKLASLSGDAFVNDLEEGKAELTKSFPNEIRTLEELISKCKIDTKTWKIDKYVQNYWGNRDNPHWQVKAFLSKRTIDNDLSLQKEFLLKEIAKKTTRVYPLSVHKFPAWINEHDRKTDNLLEISIPDLHIGKLGWAPESGEDYDMDIAIKRYRDAVKKLLSRVNLKNVEKILLPIGNDVLQIDNENYTTTSGTAVDTDGRFPKMFKAAKELFIETIEELKLIAPVDVVIVRGNHDYLSSFMLGEVLSAWYHNDPNVNIDNAPKSRKYYQYGKVGIQYTHGDKEAHSELGQLFSHEQPLIWADTKYRFCKLGHKHKTKKTNKPSFKDVTTKDTFIGFQVEILPSLSGPDEWHYTEGYIGLKQAKAFLYSKEEGEIGEFTTTVI
jgi:hypothetical protein